jgi:hypothetical protein
LAREATVATRSRSGKGSDARDEQQTQILREIWNEMKALNSRIDRKFDELKAEISELREETAKGFESLGGRVDNLLLGGHRDDHLDLRERVVRLEERMDRVERQH